MTEYTETNPLPMRMPTTHPPMASEYVDIGVWPGGWRFMTSLDVLRFDSLAQPVREELRRAFNLAATSMAER